MPNQPNNPGQQIEQPPTRAKEDDIKKTADSDKKTDADKTKSPGEGI